MLQIYNKIYHSYTQSQSYIKTASSKYLIQKEFQSVTLFFMSFHSTLFSSIKKMYA